MRLSVNVDRIKHGAMITALFFLAMNFQAKFFYFSFFAFFLLILLQKRLLIHPYTILYLALGILMAIYNLDEGILSILRCFGAVALYLVGYNWVLFVPATENESSSVQPNTAQKTAFSVVLALAAGSFTHYALNFITNNDEGISRNTIDIWSKSTMAATGQAVLASLMVGLSVAAIIMPMKKSHRYWGGLCLLCIVAYNLILAGRTLMVVIFLLFTLGTLYFLKTVKDTSKKVKLLLSLLIAVLLILAVFFGNVEGIQDRLLASNFFKRFSTYSLWETKRTATKMEFLQHAWEYPLGGLHLRQKYGYAHDLLLDGYDEYGLFGFLLLFFILLTGIQMLYNLIRHTTYSTEFKMTILCIYSAILLIFCVEPILVGSQWLFVCYCMINGCIGSLLTVNKMEHAANESLTN